MRELFTKVAVVFLAIVFISVLVNHGAIDFSLWDKTTEITKEAIQSEKGQALITETKDTSYTVAKTFLDYFSKTADEAQHEISGNSKTLNKVSLVKVVDGDTLIVANDAGERAYVRFIGIDTPESVNPNAEKNTVWGNLASDYTKSLLNGVDTVYLQFDTGKYDKYDRILAYVWLTDEVDVSDKQAISSQMLNGILLRNGYAVDKMYPPNAMYADVFAELREDAQSSKTGLWADDDFAALWD